MEESFKRPLGVTLIGGFLTLVGAFGSLVILIEMIDSMTAFGLNTVLISSPRSLMGFILYGGTPILFYATGIGLFLAQPWARTSVLLYIPVLGLLFFFHLALNLARIVADLYAAPVWLVLWKNPGIFMNVFVRYAFLVGPVIWYFRKREMTEYFQPAREGRGPAS